MDKPCSECPWIRKTKHDNIITNHAIKHKKAHNCHMAKDKNALWKIDEDSTLCKGYLGYVKKGL